MDVHILEQIRVASAVRVLRAVLGVTGQVCGVRARVRRACARLQRVLLTPASSPGPKPVQVQNRCFGSTVRGTCIVSSALLDLLALLVLLAPPQKCLLFYSTVLDGTRRYPTVPGGTRRSVRPS